MTIIELQGRASIWGDQHKKELNTPLNNANQVESFFYLKLIVFSYKKAYNKSKKVGK